MAGAGRAGRADGAFNPSPVPPRRSQPALGPWALRGIIYLDRHASHLFCFAVRLGDAALRRAESRLISVANLLPGGDSLVPAQPSLGLQHPHLAGRPGVGGAKRAKREVR